MDDYDLKSAVEPFVGFVDQLTNWYIRRSRRRFWDEKPSEIVMRHLRRYIMYLLS